MINLLEQYLESVKLLEERIAVLELSSEVCKSDKHSRLNLLKEELRDLCIITNYLSGKSPTLRLDISGYTGERISNYYVKSNLL